MCALVTRGLPRGSCNPACQRALCHRPRFRFVDDAKVESDYPIDNNKKIRFVNRIHQTAREAA